MRDMTSGLRLIGLVAGLAMGVGCSEKTGANNFVGTWTYAGAINPNCMNVAPIDLTGSVATITATDASHIVMNMVGFCMVSFEVDGFVATASSGQTCSLTIPGLGAVPIAIQQWTMMASGDVISSNVTGSAFGCFPGGMGTLTRRGDAGAVD
jgi:hypothetical protein